MKRLLLIVLFTVSFLLSHAQDKAGCTDVMARNYQPDAIRNDTSCRYYPAIYNPTLKAELPHEVNETSGLVLWRGNLWTHNDSGGKPCVYALDTNTFQVVQRVEIVNARNYDWEDIAIDSQYIYLGDIGNNFGTRDSLTIYRIKLSDIPTHGDTQLRAESLRFTFPDYVSNPKSREASNFDCEALMVSPRFLYVFTKQWHDQKTQIFRLPKEPGSYLAEKVGGFDCDGLVTGADFDAKNGRVVLVGYKNHIWQPFLWIIYDIENEKFMEAHGRRISMPNLSTVQTEGITFIDKNKMYISAEESPSFSMRIFVADLSRWVNDEFPCRYAQAKHRKFGKEINQSNDSITLKINNIRIKNGLYRYELTNGNGLILTSNKIFVGKQGQKSITLPVFENDENLRLYLFGKNKSYVVDL